MVTGEGEWLHPRGDSSLAGAGPVRPAHPLASRWRFRADAAIEATPVADSARIYAVSAKATLYALTRDGAQVWSRSLVPATDQAAMVATPSPIPPLVLAGLVVTGLTDGTLTAWDAATGAPKWRAACAGPLLAAPVIVPADSRRPVIAVITRDKGIAQAFDGRDGAVLWTAAESARCEAAPAAWHDQIVFGSCAATLRIQSAHDGAALAQAEMGEGHEIAGGAAIADGVAFVGTRAGTLAAVDLRDGRVRWHRQQSEREYFATPAVSDGRVVFISEAGELSCHRPDDGTPQWTFMRAGTPTSPVIAADRVVVGVDGVLCVVDAADGALIESVALADRITSPALVGGRVVVGTDDGFVIALGAED